MQLTFTEKKCILCSWTTIMIFLVLLMLSATQIVSGFEFPEDVHELAHRKEGDSCQIKTGGLGICRRVSSCEVYFEGLKNKTIKYSFLVLCSVIEKEEVICCPLEDTKIPTSTVGTLTPRADLTITSKSSQNNGPERPSQVACRKFEEANPAGLSFHIVGGVEVEPGQFPHMGALIVPLENGLLNRCGSSLISERYVLTAAHCLDNPDLQPTFVRFGVVEWNSDDETVPPIDVKIENITMHPEYRSHLFYHDIAVIKLVNDVPFSSVVRPACLNTDLKDLDSSIQLVVIGWGLTDVNSRVRSDLLLMANVTTVDLQICNASHNMQKFVRRYGDGLNEGQYCAIDPLLEKDSCEADSGGPLELFGEKQAIIVGVISFGRSCATATPSVYARVAYYLTWIESIVWPS